MSYLRWILWEWAFWLAYWLCPDKTAWALILKHGTIDARDIMSRRAAKEGGE